VTVHDAISHYVQARKAGGSDFGAVERVLGTFCRTVGANADISTVTEAQVRAFLDGRGPITRYWYRKHSALNGFYRYAVGRHLVGRAPLPSRTPKSPPAFTPYIFTREELRRLLAATAHGPRTWCPDPHTLRTLLLTLYGAGLRVGEALHLTLDDVDLDSACLVVRNTKFYKTRLVPLGPDLVTVLQQQLARRARRRPALPDQARFFVGRDGGPLHEATIRRAFARLRTRAGVARTDGARYQPRLHDLRHAYAVHRVTEWYRRGADVQALLPALSTYLGHLTVSATQVYLTMTPDLLQQANQRFERYAMEAVNEP
jgi:integrase/recombinase XerD